MSRKGNCWDNAVAESFFKSLKIDIDLYDNSQCATHQERQIEAFCQDCLETLCIDCILTQNHKNHEIVSVDIGAEKWLDQF